MNFEISLAELQELATVWGLKVIAAIAIVVVGRWAAKLLRGFARRAMSKGNLDPTIVGFISNILYVAVLAFVIVAALSQVGIQTASFIAVVGAAGLAIGLALQGSLSNFAAGVLMAVFRPFKVGDFIEAGGTAGIVEEIQIFTTQMRSGDNKTIIVPNSSILGGNIVNYSTKETRRVDLAAGIGYSDDIDSAKAVLRSIIDADERVLKDPEPMIVVSELGDSSVNLTVRAWVNSGDYWGVYFDTLETIKKRFDSEGISIPFPQRDVHVYQH
jgi:small conductance mechanosensitive channel